MLRRTSAAALHLQRQASARKLTGWDVRYQLLTAASPAQRVRASAGAEERAAAHCATLAWRAPLRAYTSEAGAALTEATVAAHTLRDLRPGGAMHAWLLSSLVDSGVLMQTEAKEGSLDVEPTHLPHRYR
jgi:hypothetical protein